MLFWIWQWEWEEVPAELYYSQWMNSIPDVKLIIVALISLLFTVMGSKKMKWNVGGSFLFHHGSHFHILLFSFCLSFMTFIYHSNHQIHPAQWWLITEDDIGQFSYAWDSSVGIWEAGKIIILIKVDVIGKCAQTSNKASTPSPRHQTTLSLRASTKASHKPYHKL